MKFLQRTVFLCAFITLFLKPYFAPEIINRFAEKGGPECHGTPQNFKAFATWSNSNVQSSY